jgi:hypothetical protein
MWSAFADPRVIAARARRTGADDVHAFYGSRAAIRILRGHVCEHLLIERHGVATRLDVIEGTALAGAVSLHFDLEDDAHLETRIDAIRAFSAKSGFPRPHLQLARRLHTLQAADAHAAGASLREVADLILGPGHWPGSGEHRKSRVRRMIATGEQIVRAGPRAILSC